MLNEWLIDPSEWRYYKMQKEMEKLRNFTKIREALEAPAKDINVPGKPHVLTGAEAAILLVMGAKWVSRDANSNDGSADLWREKPLYTADGFYDNEAGGRPMATIYGRSLFPSVHPGDCLGLDGLEVLE